MKIMIIGGSGRVGSDLVKDFLEKTDYEVTAAVSHPEKAKLTDGDSNRLNVVKMNLKDFTVEQMTKLMTGFDAVYFVAGSRGHDLIGVDCFGAIKTMMAAQDAHVKRYVMLSSAFSLHFDKWMNNKRYATLQDYQAAKFIADHWLIHDTDLTYTIVQPGTLLEEDSEPKVTFNDGKPGKNSINVVADVLFAVLNNKNAFDKVIIMHSGETDVDDAINDLK